GAGCSYGVARRSLCRSHKPSLMIYIRKSIITDMIFRIGHRIAEAGNVRGIQATGNALLVQVSIAGERQQAGVLVLPSKPSATKGAVRFSDRNLNKQTADESVALIWLIVGNRQQGIAVDCFNKSISHRVEGCSKRSHSFPRRNPGLYLCIREIEDHIS